VDPEDSTKDSSTLGIFEMAAVSDGFNKQYNEGSTDWVTSDPTRLRLDEGTSIVILVPTGAQVSMSGTSVLGSRELDVVPGDGPEISIRGVAILGSVEVKEARAPRPA
jgi:hypothetical protein